MQRRLAAILAADVVGYSRLMALDEANVFDSLKAVRRDLVQPLIEQFQGRIFKLMGDGFLAEFPSVVDAISCAVTIQERMASHEAGLAGNERITLRIGINLGDVLVDATDLYGDGVNIASRLEALAEPGGICVSGSALTPSKASSMRPLRISGRERSRTSRGPSAHIGSEWPRSRLVNLFMPRLRQPFPTSRRSPSYLLTTCQVMPSRSTLGDGVVEALTAALSRIRSFFVIARNSAFTYKGKVANVPTLAAIWALPMC